MTSTLLLILGSTSAPDAVLLFPDRAQVTRLTKVTCGSRTPVVFEGVPLAAATDSFRAQVTVGSVDGVRAEQVRHEKAFSAQAEALETKLEALLDDQRVLDDGMARLNEQVKLAGKLRGVAEQGISAEFVAEKPDLKAWQQALETPLQSAVAAGKQMAELEMKRRKLAREIEHVRWQRHNVEASTEKRWWRVEVLVTCPTGASAELALSYVVGGASWTPAYEARSADGEKAVEFSTYATVAQTTGEDWPAVKLTLSTAVPAQNATPPTMNKLLLGATERAKERKVLARRDEAVESAQVAASSTPSTPGAGGLLATSQGLSVQLEVKEVARVPTDGTGVRLFVGMAKFPAEYSIRIQPKLYPLAFRVADVTNAGAWPLLSGPVEVFRATGLVGRYELDRVAVGAAFTLTLGLEDSIRVKRTVVEEVKKEAGLFNAKQRFSYAYRFELTNYGKQGAELEVADHLPVAEVDDIDVSIAETTTPGYELNKATGVAKWKVALKAQERKTLTFAFRVNIPTSYETQGL
jgi:uncharacterized protein (TIGR02231 family)